MQPPLMSLSFLLTVVLMLPHNAAPEDGETFAEKSCEQVFGFEQDNWPNWIPQCRHNGTCMLYYPYDGDPYPFPYCICQVPYTGMMCEALDWSHAVTEPPRAATASVVALIFVIALTLIAIYFFHRKKKAKKNAAGRSVAYDGGENGGVALKSDDAAVSLNRGNSSGNQSQNQSGNNHSNHDSNQHKQHNEVPNGNGVSHTDGESELPAVQEELVAKRSHKVEHSAPTRVPPARSASVRVSRLIPAGDVIPFIDDDDEWEAGETAGNTNKSIGMSL